MPEKQVTFFIRCINITGVTLVFISLFLDWTINQRFFQITEYIFPAGGLFIILGVILNVFGIILYFFSEQWKIKSFLFQIASIAFISFVILIVTNNFVDFLNQLSIGYFLCGLGLILITFEIVIFFINELSFKPEKESAVKENRKNLEKIEKKFYEALNHAVRRKIISIIGGQGSASFTDFKKELKIGTGTLYHHLDVLAPLIYQKKDKKYYLNNLGKLTLKFMEENIHFLGSINLKKKSPDEDQGDKNRWRSIKKYTTYLNLESIYKVIYNREDKRLLPLMLVPISLFFTGALLGFQNHMYFFVYYAFAGSTTIPVITPMFQVPAYFFQAIFSWFAVWCYIEVSGYIYFKLKGNYLKSLIGTGFSAIPITIYEIIFYILKILGFALGTMLSGFLLIVAQICTLYLLSTFIMFHKRIKMDKTLLIVLPTHYLSILVNIALYFFL
ncbi:MAG: winged helix-turn-helix domain-containing protein [Promethearchaeota archaeon]